MNYAIFILSITTNKSAVILVSLEWYPKLMQELFGYKCINLMYIPANQIYGQNSY